MDHRRIGRGAVGRLTPGAPYAGFACGIFDISSLPLVVHSSLALSPVGRAARLPRVLDARGHSSLATRYSPLPQ